MDRPPAAGGEPASATAAAAAMHSSEMNTETLRFSHDPAPVSFLSPAQQSLRRAADHHIVDDDVLFRHVAVGRAPGPKLDPVLPPELDVRRHVHHLVKRDVGVLVQVGRLAVDDYHAAA